MEKTGLSEKLRAARTSRGLTIEAAILELRELLAYGASDAEAFRASLPALPSMLNNWLTKGVISTTWVPAVLRFLGAGPQDARDEIVARLGISPESVDALLINVVDGQNVALLDLFCAHLRVHSRSWVETRGIHSADVWWWLCTARRAVQ